VRSAPPGTNTESAHRTGRGAESETSRSGSGWTQAQLPRRRAGEAARLLDRRQLLAREVQRVALRAEQEVEAQLRRGAVEPLERALGDGPQDASVVHADGHELVGVRGRAQHEVADHHRRRETPGLRARLDHVGRGLRERRLAVERLPQDAPGEQVERGHGPELGLGQHAIPVTMTGVAANSRRERPNMLRSRCPLTTGVNHRSSPVSSS
jgi:hypothetical protein